MSDHGGEMAVADLAACVFAREQGTAADSISDVNRGTLHDELYDEDLPKLTATGVVTFDLLRDSVAVNEEFPLGTGNR